MTKDEIKRDKYYRKKYGVGLDWYEAKLKEQGGCCAICKQPAENFARRLHVDHAHDWKKIKIICERFIRQEKPDVWKAWAPYRTYLWCSKLFPTKREAIRSMKSLLQAASCRGLLCFVCNRALRSFCNDPVRMANAAEYLNRWNSSIPLTN